MKYLLLALFSLTSLIAQQTPQDVELMDKLNKIESIKKEIAAKEKYIDQLNDESFELFNCLSYGYDSDQRKLIWLESNRIEQNITHALNNNINIEEAIKEPLCPSLTVHRNELNRMQNSTVRVCVEYFLLMKLYQKYIDMVIDMLRI